ncbi:nitroreductase family protein [Candidatus Woesearchaeota archaeon]|nr:nitroreductase family protein [Candidatus Woesearchaeota archaeon]
MKLTEHRKTEQKINELFINRWSPRAMKPESITEQELLALFEAAKWAPSSYNSQPWRFIYALRDSEEWNQFLNLLIDFNKSWAKNASALIILVSRKNFEYNEEYSKTHSFDTGAAWQNLALQATMNDLIAHGIGGFDHEEARKIANISDAYKVEAMIAIGKPGNKEDLPLQLKEREQPSNRKSLKEIAFKGKLK